MAAIFGVLACLFLILLIHIFSQFTFIDLFDLFYWFFLKKGIFVSLSFPIVFLFQILYLSVFIFIIVLLVFTFVLISCTKNLDYWFVNISWYAFPSLHDFSHISHIFISLTEVYPYYFFFWEISSFTYGLLRSSLFNFQLFGDFPIVFLLLISSVISLWPENILCIIFIILTF